MERLYPITIFLFDTFVQEKNIRPKKSFLFAVTLRCCVCYNTTESKIIFSSIKDLVRKQRIQNNSLDTATLVALCLLCSGRVNGTSLGILQLFHFHTHFMG